MENISDTWKYDINIIKEGISYGKNLLKKTTLKKSQIEHIKKKY